MSENTCPNVALSRNQNMWVVKESADKTLEFPAMTDIINVTADVFANQEIPTSDSKEKANTLNKLNVFNSSASPATANFGMYLRPTALDAPMQGDALIQALQGKLAAPFTGTLADALTDNDAQLAVTVASGHVPLRGVIEVASTPSGKELIRYRKAVKDAASPGKWLLSELTRGYKGTTAASGASGAAVSLKSRTFVQALCRPNVSVWIVIDKTLQAVQGCHVTDASISVTKENAVELTATDMAGNVTRSRLGLLAYERNFKSDTISISDNFLASVNSKLGYLAPNAANQLEGYLYINNQVRAANVETLRALRKDTAAAMLWDGMFQRLPRSAARAGFGDHRYFTYQGKQVGESYHLGFDLASVRNAEVPAANNGRVVFTGELGIYGNLVVIDHGLGLMSLYSHLSEIHVKVGDVVQKGAIIAKTGSTGLAFGDHLHFGILVGGVEVTPLEWLDPKWIKDNITGRLNAQ